MFINPYIVCTYAFIVSLLYPLHGITTFPLNVLCFFGITGTKWNSMSFGTFYSIFSHAGPFLWVPWTITFESMILTIIVFLVYITSMILFYKHPYDYYLHRDGETRKELMRTYIIPLINYVVIPVIFLLSLFLYMKKKW